MVEDPLIDVNRQQWLREDTRLFLQIQNSTDSKVINLINYNELPKNQWIFCILGKGMSPKCLRCARLFIDLINRTTLLQPTSWNSRKPMRS